MLILRDLFTCVSIAVLKGLTCYVKSKLQMRSTLYEEQKETYFSFFVK